MRALLDTQVFLWANQDPDRLGAQQATVADAGNELLVSAVVSWELAIKTAIGRLRLPEPVGDYVPSRIAIAGLTAIGIDHAHTLAVADLPPHHRDPFDRLLIAQARVLGVPIITADPVLARYDVEVLPTG